MNLDGDAWWVVENSPPTFYWKNSDAIFIKVYF